MNPNFTDALELQPQKRCLATRIKSLVVVDDFAQRPHKARRYSQIRRKLMAGTSGSELVFLKRGNTGARRCIQNEADVQAALEGFGYTTVDIDTCSAAEIVTTCRNARVVVSVEGSHLAPMLYLLQDFGCMVILCPPWQVHTCVADIGVFCKLSSGIFVGERTDNKGGDFVIDVEELSRFLDAAVQFAAENRERLERFHERLGT